MEFEDFDACKDEDLVTGLLQLAGEDCHYGVDPDRTARWMFGGPHGLDNGVTVRGEAEDRTAFVDTDDLAQEAFTSHTEARRHIGMAPSVLDGRKAGWGAYIEITRDMAKTGGAEALRVSSDVQRAIFGDVLPNR